MAWDKISASDVDDFANSFDAKGQESAKEHLTRHRAAVRSWFNANFSAAEVSGALGDLGSFLPLLIALVQKVGLDLGTTLIITGLYNVITGIHFDIPICVQPMKTIAAVAISSAISLNQVLLAGIFVSGCVLLLGITRLTDLVNWLIPRSVVRGLQLAVGINLATKGLKMALKVPGPSGSTVWRPWLGADPLLLTAVALPVAVFLSIDAFNAAEDGAVSAGGWWEGLPRDTPFEPIFRLISRVIAYRCACPGLTTSPRGNAETGPSAPPPLDSSGNKSPALRSHIAKSEESCAASASLEMYSSSGSCCCNEDATAIRPPFLLSDPDDEGGRTASPLSLVLAAASTPERGVQEALAEEEEEAGVSGNRDRVSDEAAVSLLGSASSRRKGRTAPKGSGVRSGLAKVISASIQQMAGIRRGAREGGAGTLGAPSDSEGLLCFGSENGSKAVSGVNKKEEGEAACAVADARPCGDGVCVYGSSASAADRSTVLSKIPHALLFVVLGLVMAAVNDPGALRSLKLGPSVPKLLRPTAVDFRRAVFEAGLPQLPLTLLNSVLAVSYLATSLFPEKDSNRWRPSVVAVCVGSMNLVGCWLGTMPCCHGSGGLAAQYKFGARSGLAPVMLGAAKVLLGLLFGGSMFTLLKAFPQTLLGSMLVVAGVELASSIKGQRGSRDWTVLLLTAVAVLALQDTGLGFCLGLAVGLVAAAKTALTRALLAAPTRREAAAAQSKEKHTITYQEMP